jgi:hypothetical protein
MEILVYFGAITVLFMVWGAFALQTKLRKEAREREMVHAERMRALELGLPLPDAGSIQAEADMARTRAATAVGVLVPVSMAGAAAGGTLLVFHWAGEGSHLALLCVIWGVSGLVSLVAVNSSMAILQRQAVRGDRVAAGEGPPAAREDAARQEPSVAIKKPPSPY